VKLALNKAVLNQRVYGVKILPGGPFRQRISLCFLIAVVFFCAGGDSAFGRWQKKPTASKHSVGPLERVKHIMTEQIDREAVRLEDEEHERRGGPYRFAVSREVLITPQTDGTWEDIDDETRLWRLHITAPNALTINLGFVRYYMPRGGKMFIYASDESHVVGPFTEDDNKEHGQLWTPVIHSDDIVVEVTIGASKAEQLELELISINHGYRGFGRDGKADKGLSGSGSCNVNVACPAGDDWRDQIRSVAAYSFWAPNGSYRCTGVLVNNTAQDDTPYYLTAWHCFDLNQDGVLDNPEQLAVSMVIYWNYQASTCGGTFGSNGQNQSGAILRANYKQSDFLLVQLDDEPSMVFDVYYAGWDRSDTAPSNAVGIHHPEGDMKKISFENNPLSITSYTGYTSPGNATHLKVADWDVGTTEHVSSGSPIFNSNKHITGLLHGGWAACGNNESDWYGRIYRSWTGGGTASTRLSDWLDPSGIGAMSLDGRDPGRDLADFAFFRSHWLETSCDDSAGDETNWCFGCDFSKNGSVGLEDVAFLVSRWLQ
jgi:lysyl endopeptidase